MAVGKIKWQLENKMAVAGRVKAKMAVASREWQSGWAGMGWDGMGWGRVGCAHDRGRAPEKIKIDQNRSKQEADANPGLF